MAHNTKAWPAGITDGVTTLSKSELEHLDTNAYEAINGDQGGAWAPATAIDISGAGVRFDLQSGAWPGFGADAGGVRTVVRRYPPTPATRVYVGGSLTTGSWLMGGANGAVASFLIPLPDQATVTKVRSYCTIVTAHVSLPTLGPGLSLQRINPATGVLTEWLRSPQADPVRYTLPMTVASYNSAGLVYWDYVPTINNLIDRSTHYLLATFLDEDGGGAIPGNIFHGVEVTYTQTQWRP